MSRRAPPLADGPADIQADADLYARDYLAWTERQAALLRAGRLGEIDAANLAEELDDLGKSEQRELESRLAILIQHLLKWQRQPHLRAEPGQGRSWRLTIVEQRRAIPRRLARTPSLRARLPEILEDAHLSGAAAAGRAMGLDLDDLPSVCPWTVDQLLDPAFWPEATAERA